MDDVPDFIRDSDWKWQMGRKCDYERFGDES